MVEKVKITDIAGELGFSSKDVIEKALLLKFDVKNQSSTLSIEEADRLVNFILTGVDNSPQKKENKQDEKEVKKHKAEPKQEKLKKQEIEEKPKVQKAEHKKRQEEPKKEYTKIQQTIQPKKEDMQPQQNQTPQLPVRESLAEVSLKQRRGLVFVKKKKDEIAEQALNKQKSESIAAPKAAPSLESMFVNMAANMQQLSETRAKKKKPKKIIAAKKDESSKIDLLLDRSLGESSYDIEEDMVVLPDFTIKLEKRDDEQKVQIASQVKTIKHNPFLDQGIQRKS
ncbi:MAG: translation initiation factor IF-2 N-terminal domain-containing protein, partial [Campylobacteraceae bacterium]|nr:translation initiation factor IF-2 N-terminal domain-containing protein [Campylobacteraceae bacterium]